MGPHGPIYDPDNDRMYDPALDPFNDSNFEGFAPYDSMTMNILSYSDFAKMGAHAITLILDSEGFCLLATLEHIYQSLVGNSGEHAPVLKCAT